MLTDIFLELIGREAGVNRAVQGPDPWCWCEVEHLFQSWAAQITQLLYLNHLIQVLFYLGQMLNFIYIMLSQMLLSQLAPRKQMNYLSLPHFVVIDWKTNGIFWHWLTHWNQMINIIHIIYSKIQHVSVVIVSMLKKNVMLVFMLLLHDLSMDCIETGNSISHQMCCSSALVKFATLVQATTALHQLYIGIIWA